MSTEMSAGYSSMSEVVLLYCTDTLAHILYAI